MIYEIRTYQIAPGSLPEVEKRFGEAYEHRKAWEAAVPERLKMSPLVLAGSVEFGHANGFVHIWAYKSLDQRMQIREEAQKKGVWPPPGSADRLLTQETKILLPASWSPM